MQLMGEARDGHVGDSQQAIEADAVYAEFASIVRFERGLRRRQRGADGIVDQAKLEGAYAVAESVQVLQRRDAFLEDAAPALALDVRGAVAWQRADQHHVIVTVEFAEPFHPGLEHHRQVASDHHLAPRATAALDQHPEIAVELPAHRR